jgi:hypothetical protein
VAVWASYLNQRVDIAVPHAVLQAGKVCLVVKTEFKLFKIAPVCRLLDNDPVVTLQHPRMALMAAGPSIPECTQQAALLVLQKIWQRRFMSTNFNAHPEANYIKQMKSHQITSNHFEQKLSHTCTYEKQRNHDQLDGSFMHVALKQNHLGCNERPPTLGSMLSAFCFSRENSASADTRPFCLHTRAAHPFSRTARRHAIHVTAARYAVPLSAWVWQRERWATCMTQRICTHLTSIPKGCYLPGGFPCCGTSAKLGVGHVSHKVHLAHINNTHQPADTLQGTFPPNKGTSCSNPIPECIPTCWWWSSGTALHRLCVCVCVLAVGAEQACSAILSSVKLLSLTTLMPVNLIVSRS